MKNYSLSELTKILSTPESQPMNTLMEACKQAGRFLQKGKEFADAFLTIDKGPKGSFAEATEKLENMENAAGEHVQGACNIYVTGIRPIKGKPQASRVEIPKTLREASGDLNSAPRMTLQKANELLGNLELGDQATFIRTVPQMEEASEIVVDLLGVGIQAEIRN